MHNITLESQPFEAVYDTLGAHYQSLAAPIESFLEDHIVDSDHYHMMVDDQVGGVASVYDRTLLTQFVVACRFRPISAQLFSSVLQATAVKSAFVPTCDELYLSCALDRSAKVAQQAYVWQAGEEVFSAENLTLITATPADQPLIVAQTGDFFGDLPTVIARGDLFIGLRDGQPVGFGISEPSRFYPATASIGMYTVETFRQQGVGTDLIRALVAVCRQRGVRPVAGCYYYNHASRNTLIKAGMFAQTRLLKIDLAAP